MKPMTLILAQTIQHFTLQDDIINRYVKLRILEPSTPFASWPGNFFRLHEWTATRPMSPSYEPMTKEEITQMEALLGVWKKFEFTTHPTLGLVTVEPLDEPLDSRERGDVTIYFPLAYNFEAILAYMDDAPCSCWTQHSDGGVDCDL